MDPTSMKVLWDAVVSDAGIVIPAMLLTGGFVWWLVRYIEAGSKDGLKEQNAALTERIKLAQEQAQVFKQRSEELHVQVESLKLQIAAPVPDIAAIAKTTASIANTAGQISTANTELSSIMAYLKTAQIPSLTLQLRKAKEEYPKQS
jgi:hypothetical protein